MAVRRATFRLYPNSSAGQKLHYARKLHKDLYNAALYNRKTQYIRLGHSVDYYEQQNSLPAFKQVWTEYKQLGSHALQATLKRVDFAYQRFFKGLGKYPKFKSIRHYSGWTYPDNAGWKCHSIGNNGYLQLTDLGVSIQMRGKARLWGKPTTCTIVYRNGNWYASITINVDEDLLKTSRQLGNKACGIDLGCKSAVSIVSDDGNKLGLHQVDAPKFLRNAEQKIKHLSKAKRNKRAPNGRKKVKASRRFKKAQKRVSKVYRKVANCRTNWVHDIANRVIKSGHSRALRAPRFAIVAMEKLEVNKMTRKAKKGKRKKQKAGLNKSILDVGFGMLTAAIRYKVEESGGVFVEVPTRKVKPSQTCPKCGNQCKKTLDERIHMCKVCGFTLDRDLAAALVMLLWAIGKLPVSGTGIVDGEPQALLKTPHKCGGFKQLAAAKRQKSRLAESGLETQTSTLVSLGSSWRSDL